VRRIARLARIGPGSPVVEVGAGAGSLTLALAETGADVIAVEVDRHVLPLLRATVEAAGDAAVRVRVVEGDAMTVDWSELLAGAPAWTLVSNLPYNVATPLIIDLLDTAPSMTRMLVMVQREAGERLVAPPGSRVYGIPSVRVAYWATSRIAGRVGPDVFLPRPRVE
jgi:16S rRNA (adenine1518-N6/adenine1519-N6)-dimethyltransferase